MYRPDDSKYLDNAHSIYGKIWRRIFTKINMTFTKESFSLLKRFPHFIPDLSVAYHDGKEPFINSFKPNVFEKQCKDIIAVALNVFSPEYQDTFNTDFRNLNLLASVTLDVIVVKLLVSDYFKFKKVQFLSGQQNTSHVCRGNQSEMDQFENRYYTFLCYLEEVENRDSGLHLIHIKRLESYIVKNIENENNTCAICQDDYKLNQKCGITNCYHSFHMDCLKPWLLEHRDCPLCRSIIKTE